VPVLADTRKDGRPDAVEAGRGLGARGRHHPGEPVRDHDPQQGQGGQRPDQPLPGPVDDEHRGHGVDEAGEAGEPVGRHDQHDGQHRDRVQGAGQRPGPDDRGRDVAGRVAQLLAGRRRQLEAEEVVDQHGGDDDEHRPGGRQVAGGGGVDPVASRVQDDGQGEEAEQGHLGGRPGQRDPLAGPQRRHRQRHRRPDEGKGHRDPPAALKGHEQPVDHGDAGDGGRAADPDGRLQEVDERDERPGVAPEGKSRPHVRAALVREGGAELGDGQPGGHEEEHGHDGQPDQRLGAALGHRPEGVEHDDGRDQQADGVQPPQLAAELGPLDERALGGGGVGRQLHRTDRGHGGSPSMTALPSWKPHARREAVPGDTQGRCHAAHRDGSTRASIQDRRVTGREQAVLRSGPGGT